MRLDLFIVADSARAGASNKLEIGGAFVTTVKSNAEPPIAVASLAFIARFMVDEGDAEKTHKIELRVVDGDDDELLATPPQEIPPDFISRQIRESGREAAVIVTTEVHGFRFPSFGDYEAQLLLNEEHVGRRFIQVQKVAADEIPPEAQAKI